MINITDSMSITTKKKNTRKINVQKYPEGNDPMISHYVIMLICIYKYKVFLRTSLYFVGVM